MPLSDRYSQQVGDSLREQRLAVIVSAAWQAASGQDIDATRLKAEAEAMVPDEDDDGWTAGRTYAGNAAAAAAYTLRTWLTNAPQEAAWAARQLFDVADLLRNVVRHTRPLPSTKIICNLRGVSAKGSLADAGFRRHECPKAKAS